MVLVVLAIFFSVLDVECKTGLVLGTENKGAGSLDCKGCLNVFPLLFFFLIKVENKL